MESGHWRGAAHDLTTRHVALPKILVVHCVDGAPVHNLAVLVVLAVCSLGSDRRTSGRGFLARSWRRRPMAFPLSRVRYLSVHDASRLHGAQPPVATSIVLEMRARPYCLMSAIGAEAVILRGSAANDCYRGFRAEGGLAADGPHPEISLTEYPRVRTAVRANYWQPLRSWRGRPVRRVRSARHNLYPFDRECLLP